MEQFVPYLLQQAPVVVFMFVVWWLQRQDYHKEIGRLQERLSEKDAQIMEFIQGMNNTSVVLAKILERLRK